MKILTYNQRTNNNLILQPSTVDSDGLVQVTTGLYSTLYITLKGGFNLEGNSKATLPPGKSVIIQYGKYKDFFTANGYVLYPAPPSAESESSLPIFLSTTDTTYILDGRAFPNLPEGYDIDIISIGGTILRSLAPNNDWQLSGNVLTFTYNATLEAGLEIKIFIVPS